MGEQDILGVHRALTTGIRRSDKFDMSDLLNRTIILEL